MASIVNQSQENFVLGHNFHDHILQAYKLIRGYRIKGGIPRCILHLNIQKAYDTVDWFSLEKIL